MTMDFPLVPMKNSVNAGSILMTTLNYTAHKKFHKILFVLRRLHKTLRVTGSPSTKNLTCETI